MVPIYKKGDRTDAINYRGITSLCAIAKVFELVIYKNLLYACRSYPYQHEFFPKKSTTTKLVEFVTYCTSQIDAGAQVEAIYTYLKAAFDSLPHAILLAKLDKLGFPCSLVQWLKSYLINRSCSNID